MIRRFNIKRQRRTLLRQSLTLFRQKGTLLRQRGALLGKNLTSLVCMRILHLRRQRETSTWLRILRGHVTRGRAQLETRRMENWRMLVVWGTMMRERTWISW